MGEEILPPDIEAKDIPNLQNIPWEAGKVIQALNDQRKVNMTSTTLAM